MKVLIGSQALLYHGRLKHRMPADYDFIYDKPIENAEVLDFNEKTNYDLYNYCQNQNYPIIDTPFGKALVPSLDVLKAIKIGSLPINKNKHEFDLIQLETIKINEFLEQIVKQRTIETINRIKKQKFFKNANFKRIIDHDIIHSYISVNPMYKRILKNDSQYLGDKKLFNNLSFEDKSLLLFEEILVFGIERDLLPKISNCPSLIIDLVNNFKKTEKSSDPCLYWFFKFSQNNGIKGTPIWQSQWVRDNQSILIENLKKYWIKSINDLSVDFWDLVIIKTFEKTNEKT